MGKERFERQLSKAISARSRSHNSSIKQKSSEAISKTTKSKTVSVIKSQLTSATNDTTKKGATLIEEEKAALGGVKMDVYLYYAKCIGTKVSLLTVIFWGHQFEYYINI